MAGTFLTKIHSALQHFES